MRTSASRIVAVVGFAAGAFFFIALLGAWSYAPPSQPTETPEPRALPQTAYNCDAVSEIPTLECEALVALASRTFGNYLKDAGWLTGNTPCKWAGVTCGDGHVRHIKVIRQWIGERGGSITPELGNLVYLQSLDLSDNNLTGSIPPELGNLTDFQSLDLSHNQLTGSIPPELGNLTNLQSLSLQSNTLRASLPPELGNLVHLRSLDLSGTGLIGEILPELGNLADLQSLDLSYNQLTGSIPPELGNLVHLRSLDLRYTQLTGSIPPELGNLANLQSLDLSTSELDEYGLTGGIPPELGNLTHLQSLHLGGHRLTGGIPPELGNLANLQSLYLGAHMGATGLTGSLPPELGNLAWLRELDLRDNQHLTGSVPLGFCLRNIFRYSPDITFGTEIRSCESQLAPSIFTVWVVLLVVAVFLLATPKKRVGQLLILVLFLVAIAYFVNSCIHNL